MGAGVSLRSMDRASQTPHGIGSSAGVWEMSHTGHLRVWLPVVVILTLLLAGPLVSWAHVDPFSTVPSSQGSPAASTASHPWFPPERSGLPAVASALLLLILFSLRAAVVVIKLSQWRRVTALSLVLVIGIFTFATAVHSVHHLSEPEKAAECLVFAASQYVSGTTVEPCQFSVPELSLVASSCVSVDKPALPLIHRFNQPRAPPSFPV
jgi:hypothetical protein